MPQALTRNKQYLVLVGLYRDTEFEGLAGLEGVAVPLLTTPAMLVMVVNDTALVGPWVKMEVSLVSTFEIHPESGSTR